MDDEGTKRNETVETRLPNEKHSPVSICSRFVNHMNRYFENIFPLILQLVEVDDILTLRNEWMGNILMNLDFEISNQIKIFSYFFYFRWMHFGSGLISNGYGVQIDCKWVMMMRFCVAKWDLRWTIICELFLGWQKLSERPNTTISAFLYSQTETKTFHAYQQFNFVNTMSRRVLKSHFSQLHLFIFQIIKKR